MIEAMACGTPVIAFRAGSVPEIIDSGVNGFVVESIEEAAKAVSQVQYLDRTRCRRSFEERFSSARMAADYIRVYERLRRSDRLHRRGGTNSGGGTSTNMPFAASE
jgi:glycosyltransferase involved in cell wall biosynthesis